ncbi:MAG TPA: tRNA lysidine(34) synthetase TilS [Rhizomicrobium sp.]|nr:tRNA lysidine(34) synthetase TilS [Rhizomicrobium sp.]
MARVGAPWPAAVAVSGGGDSLALMHLLAGWAKANGRPKPVVLVVDHALRDGSAAEAKKAAAAARKAGLPVHILTRKGIRPKSGIEALARDARYSLMGRWLKRHGIAHLYVGHTLDDQAETFLLRLGRGSGLDGLSAMRVLAPFPVPGFEDLTLARPLLGMGRAHLRNYLTARRQDWLEDPMNSETRFARSRIRALLPALDAAGLSSARIADAAAHLARARAALELATEAVLARAARAHGTHVALDAKALAAAPREIGLRALAALLMAVSGEAYRPRFEALERLFDRLACGKLGNGATLHGCRLYPAPRAARLFGPETLVLAKESSRTAAKRP